MDIIDINLLDQKYERGLDKRLTIDGVTRVYRSYKFPIDLLYYNDLNGRISSYIEEYNDTHDDKVDILKNQNKNDYNEKLAQFVIDSACDNGTSFENTTKDIYEKGQQIPGVILTDGRIIDGNRRFTAIRKNYKEYGDAKFYYFEAVCLKAPEKDDINGWRRIKSLELNLQFNVDEKRGYNKIDELVSFYHDVMDENTKMFEEKSYCFSSGLKASKFNNNKKIVQVMLDYLEWRGKPKAFYILKNEKLDGPIEEIVKTKAKMSEEEWNTKKDTIYQYMTIVDEGDRTRNVRDLCNSAKNEGELFNTLTNELQSSETIEEVTKYIEIIDKKAQTPEQTTEKAKNKNILRKKVNDAFKDGKFIENEKEASQEPVKQVEKAINILATIDIAALPHIKVEDKEKLSKKIELIKQLIESIENVSKK